MTGRGLWWVSRAAVLCTVAVATCAMAATVAWATGTLDQSNNVAAEEFAWVGHTDQAGQTFTAGLTGVLDTVQVNVCQNVVGEDFVVQIEGTKTDALSDPPVQLPDDSNVLATQSMPASSVVWSCSDNGTLTVPFDDPASVEAGTTYAIVLSSPAAPGCCNGLEYGISNGDVYQGGQACTSFGSIWACNPYADILFATFVTTPPVPPSADVAVSVSGPSSAKKGALVTYIVTVSNTGPDTAHNVVLAVPVPTGMSLQGVSTTKGSCAKPSRKNPAISCALGDLQAVNDAHTTVGLKITAKAGSNIAGVITANSTGDGDPATPDPNTSNNSAALSTTVTK